LTLSASNTDNDAGIVKHDHKNKFTFPHWKSLHKLNTKPLESNAHSS